MSDIEKDLRVMKGRPGSACPKGHLVSNTEFTPEPICTASRQYQKLKLEQLTAQNLEETEYKKRFKSVVAKACICSDLGEPALIINSIPSNVPRFTAVCPGPNIAYFSKIATLKESKIALTSQIAAHQNWTSVEIDARQKALAELAVKAWPAAPR